ncbi:hypothetical protein CesoFtcFv8_009592 [Champsocephalus esox]|uniref:YqaJ viral recombinase domain-containing protein n=1 Tax=Champsocephalus esox TaxID=159716 RepID=A0AAN8CD15_9TELE|nr:hypothetical protein CesoFtcFv8_009592 [Champsocephalus esox]
MHAKGHSTKCEVEWSGRNQEGAGLTVGEEVVNSYLSRVATTTKYMSKARRTDMITIRARGWNLRKKQNLHRYLSQRYVKTKKRTDEMDKDIQNLQTKLQTTEEGMKQWVKEVEEWAASSPKSTNCQDQQGLQRVMEALALKIKQRKIELYRTIDNNKDRKPKREIIAKNKRRLEEAIAAYNNLVLDTEAVDTADAVLRSSRAVQREIQQIEKDLCKQSCPFAMSLEAYEGLKDLLKKRPQEMEKQKEEAFSTYRPSKLKTTAIMWGNQHEQVARQQDAEGAVSSVHSDLKVNNCGLLIKREQPFLAASPDAMLACSCHGMGVLEIKCPFKCLEMSVEEVSKEKDSCLDQNLELRESPVLHANATSMCVTGASHFLVWLPTAGHVCSVFPHQEYALTSGPVSTAFGEGHIRPELLFRKVELGTKQSEHGNKQGHVRVAAQIVYPC